MQQNVKQPQEALLEMSQVAFAVGDKRQLKTDSLRISKNFDIES